MRIQTIKTQQIRETRGSKRTKGIIPPQITIKHQSQPDKMYQRDILRMIFVCWQTLFTANHAVNRMKVKLLSLQSFYIALKVIRFRILHQVSSLNRAHSLLFQTDRYGWNRMNRQKALY